MYGKQAGSVRLQRLPHSNLPPPHALMRRHVQMWSCMHMRYVLKACASVIWHASMLDRMCSSHDRLWFSHALWTLCGQNSMRDIRRNFHRHSILRCSTKRCGTWNTLTERHVCARHVLISDSTARHCFWQALWVHCTEMHTSRTPPTPCQSLTTTETLCTHLVWRPKKNSQIRLCISGNRTKVHQATSPGFYQLRWENNCTRWAVLFSHWNANQSKLQITSFCWEPKSQLMPKIMNHLFTYYLNCVGKSNPVCLIQQLPLVVLLASYVQWLYFLIWPGKIDPFTFSHLC